MAATDRVLPIEQGVQSRSRESVNLTLWRSMTFDDDSISQSVKNIKRIQRSSSHGALSSHMPGTASTRKKQPPRMRLPPFETLGISAHKPMLSEWQLRDLAGSSKPTGSRSQMQRSAHLSDPQPLERPFAFLGSTPLLTPPDDIDSIKWNTAVTQGSDAPANAPTNTYSHAEPVSGVQMAGSDARSNRAEPAAQQTPTQSNETHSTISVPEAVRLGDSWDDFLKLGIGANISAVVTSDSQLHGVTVISQTLPHPLQETSEQRTAFTATIEAIQSRFDGLANPPYIKITHAVPPQFTLRNLPSSPPSTPSRQGGEDYFSVNVFSNAAPVPIYHLFDGNVDREAPSSPAPIVPPSSVQVALIERYIPPSTAQEHLAFFSQNGPSVLVDRLVELSPNGGSLMLVYPTKKGAQSFRSDYVGPLLDSLLRTMVVVHDMSSDFASSLGRMPAINQMAEFAEMKDKIKTLCARLSRGVSSAHRPQYSLVYANSGNVPLSRTAWSEWFLQQETPRMRAALKAYWQRGQRLPSSKDGVIPATLLRDIKICVEKGEYDGGQAQGGVEVGVFVIRRTK